MTLLRSFYLNLYLLSQILKLLTLFIRLHLHVPHCLIKIGIYVLYFIMHLQNLYFLLVFSFLQTTLNIRKQNFNFLLLPPFFLLSLFGNLLQLLSDSIKYLVIHSIYIQMEQTQKFKSKHHKSKSISLQVILFCRKRVFIIMNSNKLQQLRSNYRSQLRKDQIKNYQAQIRKSLITYWKHTIKQCSFCCNNQLSQQISHVISYQLIGIFNRSYVCSGHIQLLFSKIMQTIQSEPSNLEHLIYKDSEQQTELYIRKVFLLLQIISNEILIKNKQIQIKIYNAFKNSNSFGQILFDSAFGLNNTSFYQSEQTRINLNADAKRISFNTLLFIFYKYPLLLINYFEDYPIVWFLRECNQNRMLEIYEVLSEIFESTRTVPSYQKIYLHAESCLKEHIQESKTLKSSYEVQQKLFWLINNFLTINPLPNYDLILEILQLCKNKKPRLIKKIHSKLRVLSQQTQQLDEYHRQSLTNILSMIQHFYDSNCDNQMEIE